LLKRRLPLLLPLLPPLKELLQPVLVLLPVAHSPQEPLLLKLGRRPLRKVQQLQVHSGLLPLKPVRQPLKEVVAVLCHRYLMLQKIPPLALAHLMLGMQ
jgi:hypothetical protein